VTFAFTAQEYLQQWSGRGLEKQFEMIARPGFEPVAHSTGLPNW